MEIIHQHKEFGKLAMIDQLTGLYNRRYLESYITTKIREYHELKIPFGLAFLDIDDFKNVNDQYGHDIGDLVLKSFSTTCQATIRQSDLFARFGGEEFICIYTGIDKEGLCYSTEKLRMLIESSTIKDRSLEISIAVSIGATIVNEQDNINTLLKRADQLMYQSKSNGKNQITID
jgi:diguanylate cyclase (GGDEF)-like protein